MQLYIVTCAGWVMLCAKQACGNSVRPASCQIWEAGVPLQRSSGGELVSLAKRV